MDMTVDTFLDSLDTGVHLCQLAAIIQEKATECRRADPTLHLVSKGANPTLHLVS